MAVSNINEDMQRQLYVKLQELKMLSNGTLDGLNDVIFDIEAHLSGKPEICPNTTKGWIKESNKIILRRTDGYQKKAKPRRKD